MGMEGGGQKRVAWDGSKENLAQKKIFLFMEKVTFEDSKERLVQMENFWLVKRLAFEDSKQSFLQMKVFWLEKRLAFEDSKACAKGKLLCEKKRLLSAFRKVFYK